MKETILHIIFLSYYGIVFYFDLLLTIFYYIYLTLNKKRFQFLKIYKYIKVFKVLTFITLTVTYVTVSASIIQGESEYICKEITPKNFQK